MTRSIIMSWRNYQPWGKRFYDPMWYGFLKNLKLWADEFDKLYILDSLWNFTQEDVRQLSLVKDNFEIVVTDPADRYYDAYKKFLPQVKEDLVMFMDNDMVVYKEGIVRGAFLKLEPSLNNSDTYDVVSIYDTIGTYKTDKLNGKNKFCPYFFATRTELLKRYLDVDWGDHLPHSETFGFLTEAMLNDNITPFEWPEDKNSIYFDGTQDEKSSKDIGTYHIRAGSTPAYLLAEKKYGNLKTYQDYLDNQPKSEYLRQMAWVYWMCEITQNGDMTHELLGIIRDVFPDMIVSLGDNGLITSPWSKYMDKFIKYHGL